MRNGFNESVTRVKRRDEDHRGNIVYTRRHAFLFNSRRARRRYGPTGRPRHCCDDDSLRRTTLRNTGGKQISNTFHPKYCRRMIDNNRSSRVNFADEIITAQYNGTRRRALYNLGGGKKKNNNNNTNVEVYSFRS